jgi:transposase-like protein
VDLHKWFVAIRLVFNSPRGISVRQLAKEIGVNKNTACYMLKRIRQAIAEEQELMQRFIDMKES